ncbi:MAG: hypothetical protein QXU99_05335 [Candidatus Bathyarchaeia archaeon]
MSVVKTVFVVPFFLVGVLVVGMAVVVACIVAVLALKDGREKAASSE